MAIIKITFPKKKREKKKETETKKAEMEEKEKNITKILTSKSFQKSRFLFPPPSLDLSFHL